MAQDYEVLSFEKGDFQDNFGNYWCNAALKGVSEPVRWVVKDPLAVAVGDVVYGEVKDMTSKAGKPYLRFYKQQREEGDEPVYASKTTAAIKSTQNSRNDNTQDSIARSVALKAAVDWHTITNGEEAVLKTADIFLDWLQKDFNTGSQPPLNGGSEVVKEQTAPAASTLNDDEDADYASLLKTAYAADNIDINDIPF